ncbi:hypothetical protein [Kribbella sp. NPDC006257]|uniref:TolB family protein n=1 Tax=Kribbella sp. NPDC006257 TaxID=3156738 RepID=UPI0033BA7314
MNRIAPALLATAALLAASISLSSTAIAARNPANGQLVFDRGDSEIFIADPDGGGVRELTPAYGQGCCARWSPDGLQLAYPAMNTETGGTGTAIQDADGAGFRILPRPAPDLVAGCNVWSPDAELLACEVWNLADESFHSGVFTVRSSDGRGLRRLTTNPYQGGTDLVMDYSPNGKHIVLFRDQGGEGGESALFVIDSDGAQIRQITAWGAVRNGGSWSPDGNWILFNDYRGRLWKVHPDGTGMKKIDLDVKRGAFAFEPVWSPDGGHIAFSLWDPTLGQDDIYTARANGTGVTQVTNTPEHEGNVDWGIHRTNN